MQPGSSVFILTPLYGWRPLVFHAARWFDWRTTKADLDDGWTLQRDAAMTRCGRERYWSVSERSPDRRAFRRERDWSATLIRLDRAERIARPCVRCFPTGVPE